MSERDDVRITPDQIDEALQAFWRGSAAEFERLIAPNGSDRPGVASELLGVLQILQSAERSPDTASRKKRKRE